MSLRPSKNSEPSGGPLSFFQSGSCCDGSRPLCFGQSDLIVGDHDVQLGGVAGCPSFEDKQVWSALGNPSSMWLMVRPKGSRSAPEIGRTSSPSGAWSSLFVLRYTRLWGYRRAL